MSDQRLPVAFAASNHNRHCEERNSAMQQSPAGNTRVPDGDCFASLAMTANGWDAQRTALVITGSSAAPPPHPHALSEGRRNDEGRSTHDDFAVVRHAGSAAAAQAGACRCCRVPSDLVTVLRRLAIERARGEIDIVAVLVAGEAADLARLEQDVLADPFVAARYVVRTAR
jgi:hypothetical protein